MAEAAVLFEGVPETLEAKEQALSRMGRSAAPEAILSLWATRAATVMPAPEERPQI